MFKRFRGIGAAVLAAALFLGVAAQSAQAWGGHRYYYRSYYPHHRYVVPYRHYYSRPYYLAPRYHVPRYYAPRYYAPYYGYSYGYPGHYYPPYYSGGFGFSFGW